MRLWLPFALDPIGVAPIVTSYSLALRCHGAAQARVDEPSQGCRKNLAGYKVPRTIVFAEIPKTSTGKIQKYKLLEMAKTM